VRICWPALLGPEVRDPMGQIDSHDLPLAAWSSAPEVGPVMVVWLEAILMRFGVFASHRLNVARRSSSASARRPSSLGLCLRPMTPPSSGRHLTPPGNRAASRLTAQRAPQATCRRWRALSRSLAVVPEPAGIPATRSERSSQQDTRTEDDHVADSGREQARNHNQTKPDQPGNDQPPRLESITSAVNSRVQPTAKPRSA
jgi:hypothetical protein